MTLDIPTELMLAAAAVDVLLVGYAVAWALQRVLWRIRHHRTINRRLRDLHAQRLFDENPYVVEHLRRAFGQLRTF